MSGHQKGEEDGSVDYRVALRQTSPFDAFASYLEDRRGTDWDDRPLLRESGAGET